MGALPQPRGGAAVPAQRQQRGRGGLLLAPRRQPPRRVHLRPPPRRGRGRPAAGPLSRRPAKRARPRHRRRSLRAAPDMAPPAPPWRPPPPPRPGPFPARRGRLRGASRPAPSGRAHARRSRGPLDLRLPGRHGCGVARARRRLLSHAAVSPFCLCGLRRFPLRAGRLGRPAFKGSRNRSVPRPQASGSRLRCRSVPAEHHQSTGPAVIVSASGSTSACPSPSLYVQTEHGQARHRSAVKMQEVQNFCLMCRHSPYAARFYICRQIYESVVLVARLNPQQSCRSTAVFCGSLKADKSFVMLR